jgi:hypothetical protein
MATSDVKVTPGTGKNVASYSFTEDAESKEIQRIGLNKSDGTEIGTVANPIVVSAGGSMAVYFDRGNPSVTIAGQAATLDVRLDPGYTLGNVGTVDSITKTVAVYFDRGNPAVNANISGQSATLNVSLDPGHTLGSISGIGSSVGVYFDRGSPTVIASPTGTQAVYFDQSNPNVKVNYGSGTFLVAFDRANPSVSIGGASASLGVYFDRGNPNVTANAGTGTFTVQFDSSKGFLQGINTSVGVYFDRGAPTVTPAVAFNSGVVGATTQRVVQAVDTISSINIVGQSLAFLNCAHTAAIYTASGSVTAQGGSNVNTIINPSANYSFKVFAFSLTTTGQVSNNVRFSNGSSAAATEFWRVALIAPSGGMAGANLAVPPPAYLFATGTSTTLALWLGEASIVHYSVSYIKETA